MNNLKTEFLGKHLNRFFDFYGLMKKKYTVLIEKDEAGWLVSEVMELPGCHTQAKTMTQLIERTKEAIKAYLKQPLQKVDAGQFVGVKYIEV